LGHVQQFVAGALYGVDVCQSEKQTARGLHARADSGECFDSGSLQGSRSLSHCIETTVIVETVYTLLGACGWFHRLL
jgi:hypothetical protein